MRERKKERLPRSLPFFFFRIMTKNEKKRARGWETFGFRYIIFWGGEGEEEREACFRSRGREAVGGSLSFSLSPRGPAPASKSRSV